MNYLVALKTKTFLHNRSEILSARAENRKKKLPEQAVSAHCEHESQDGEYSLCDPEENDNGFFRHSL